MIISSLIFGIYHMNWTQGVYAAILGCCMAYVYNKVRSLLVPMLIHMSANTVVLIVGEFSANIEYSSLDMSTLTVVAISIFVLPFMLAIAGILYFKMRKVNL